MPSVAYHYGKLSSLQVIWLTIIHRKKIDWQLMSVHGAVERKPKAYNPAWSIPVSSPSSDLSSLPDIIFIRDFVARPTAWEVFFAAPTTTGCIEMIGRLALSWMMAAIGKQKSILSPFMKTKLGNSEFLKVIKNVKDDDERIRHTDGLFTSHGT